MKCRYAPRIFGAEYVSGSSCVNLDIISNPQQLKETTCTYANGGSSIIKILGTNFISPKIWIDDQLTQPLTGPINDASLTYQYMTISVDNVYSKTLSIVVYNDCDPLTDPSCGRYSYAYNNIIRFNVPTYSYSYAIANMQTNFVTSNRNWMKVFLIILIFFLKPLNFF